MEKEQQTTILEKIKKLWLEISNYGIKGEDSYLERIRIRVLNQGIIIVAFIQISILLLQLYPFNIEGAISRFIITIVLFFLLYLNKNKRHEVSRLVLNTLMPIMILTIGVLYGQETGIQYNFLTFILTSFFFHKKLVIKLSLTAFNFILFLILKYYWTYYDSVMQVQENSFFELITFTITATVIMSIMYIFLSEIERYNERNKKLLERLEEKNARLQVANEELERFAYIASHDLKTPLRTIISFTGLLERDFKRNKLDSFPDYFSFVKKGAKQMDSLISSTLEYSKANHQTEMETKEIDLKHIIDDLKEKLIQNYDHKVQIEITELPIIVAEEEQITLLFQNLIENGLKYNESNNKIIKIKSIPRPDNILITVEDNGIGIDEKYHEQIFSMFKRLHTSTQYEGTGLGLAICKKIVDRMKGQMWLESAEGKGTTFYIQLPKTLK